MGQGSLLKRLADLGAARAGIGFRVSGLGFRLLTWAWLEQASGALRSLCVNSPANKLEVNRVNGVSALVHVLSSRWHSISYLVPAFSFLSPPSSFPPSLPSSLSLPPRPLGVPCPDFCRNHCGHSQHTLPQLILYHS